VSALIFAGLLLSTGEAHASCVGVNVRGNLTCGPQVQGQVFDANPNELDFYGCIQPGVVITQPGPDHTWDLVCPATGNMQVTLSGLDCDLDLFVISDCDPSGSCHAGSSNAGLADEVVQANCVAGQTVQVVVEAFGHISPLLNDSCGPAEGHYTLDADQTEPGCAAAEVCDNGLDDDYDGLADCADPACVGQPICAVENCFNGIDDDIDGLMDCADPECAAEPLCNVEDCTNAIDDDGDGWIDCADPDCTASPVCNIDETCDNGVDDNFNGLVDCADSMCFDESFCCDDDGDGFEDVACGGVDCDDSLYDPLDTDSDQTPDSCDNCPSIFNINQTDEDGDGWGDLCDVCPDASDAVDEDADGTPDGCDLCPGFPDDIDADGDVSPDGCDVCPGGDDRIDADGDTMPDHCDVCPGGDDRVDVDGNGTPDLCDQPSGTDPGQPTPFGPDPEGEPGLEEEKKGLIGSICGCQTIDPGGWMGGWLIAAALACRRRRDVSSPLKRG